MICDSGGQNVRVLYSKGIVIVGSKLILASCNLYGYFYLLLATRNTLCQSYFHTVEKSLELTLVISKNL